MLPHQKSAVWPHSWVTSLVCGVVLLRFVTESYNMGVNYMRHQPVYGRGPHRFLLAGSRAAHGKITVIGIPNCLNSDNFVAYTQFKIRPRATKYNLWAAGWRPMVYCVRKSLVIFPKQIPYFPTMATEAFPILFSLLNMFCNLQCLKWHANHCTTVPDEALNFGPHQFNSIQIIHVGSEWLKVMSLVTIWWPFLWASIVQ
jgi:hypothetical protein